MFCNEISWHDLLIRQASGKFADCAVQFENWQIGQIGRLDGTVTPVCSFYRPFFHLLGSTSEVKHDKCSFFCTGTLNAPECKLSYMYFAI